MLHKYPDGTTLKYIGKHTQGFFNGNFYTVRKSKNYPDSYKVDEMIDDPGWVRRFIEDIEKFILVKRSWKEVIEK